MQPRNDAESRGRDLSLPRPRRLTSSGFDSTGSPEAPQPSPYRGRAHPREDEPTIRPDLVRENERGRDGPRRRKNAEERQRSPSLTNARSSVGSLTPRDRFNDAKEKFLTLEREKQEEHERRERVLANERRRARQTIEHPISPAVNPIKRSVWPRTRDCEEDVENLSRQEQSTPEDYKGREGVEYMSDLGREQSCPQGRPHTSVLDSDEYSARRPGNPTLPYDRRDDLFVKVNSSPFKHNIDGYDYTEVTEDRSDLNVRRRYVSPGREPSPENKLRKERCDSPSNDEARLAPYKYRRESSFEEVNPKFAGKIPRSHLSANPVPFADNNDSIPLERYRSPLRVNAVPKPAPRLRRYPSKASEEDEDRRDYRHRVYSVPATRESRNYSPRVHYDANDKKRMVMYETLEDERRRNSNELAKEFKRRSFQDRPGLNVEMTCNNGTDYQELDNRERYPGLDRESARIHQEEDTATAGRYRHSYAEPFQQYRQPSQHHEMLHRTNSSLSSGRVGIAAIHPY